MSTNDQMHKRKHPPLGKSTAILLYDVFEICVLFYSLNLTYVYCQLSNEEFK